MNLLDRTIALINPRLALERARFRNMFRHYEGATKGRRGKSMEKARSTGANMEITGALSTLRDRSRFFVRNNSWAKRAIEALSDHVVGEGIRPAPVGTRSQVKKVKEIWKTWAESTACDWDERNTFYGLQLLIMRTVAEGGDVMVIRRKVRPTFDNPIPIKLQVLEGDQLDHSKDISAEPDGGYTRLGVKFDKDGRKVGYYVFDQHPYDMTGNYRKLDSTLIPKEDCIHVYEMLRPGQVRGVPMGVSCFLKMSDFGDYEDAQLVRQKAAASFAGFVTGADEKSIGNDALEYLEPGTIQYLRTDESITFSNPPTTEGYDAYSKKILQGIAAGYSITYEMLTMDYSNVNFSSGRMAKIDISGNFRKLQYNMLVPQLCVPVWNWFMEGAILTGLTAKKLVCGCTDWTAPRVQQLDPVKETNATVLQIQSGITTLSEVIRERGRDPEEQFEEMKEERSKLAEMGINITSIVIPPEPTEDNNKDNGKNEGNKD